MCVHIYIHVAWGVAEGYDSVAGCLSCKCEAVSSIPGNIPYHV